MLAYNSVSAFFIFCAAFVHLGWSNIYSASLTYDLWLFLSFLLVINLLFGILLELLKLDVRRRYRRRMDAAGWKNIDTFILMAFLTNWAVAGSLPILELVQGRNYKEISALPLYQGLFLPLVISRVLMHLDSIGPYRKRILLFWLFVIFSHVSRIGLFILLAVIMLKNLDKKAIRRSIILLPMLAVLFGALGTLRTFGTTENSDVSKMDLSLEKLIFEPSQDFERTGLPDITLWGYVYMVSPIKNLESALTSTGTGPKAESIVRFISPNFVSSYFEYEKDKSFLVIDRFNTSTIYGELIDDWGLLSGVFGIIFVNLFVLLNLAFARFVGSDSLKLFIFVSFLLTLFSNIFNKEIYLFSLFFFAFTGWFQRRVIFVRS